MGVFSRSCFCGLCDDQHDYSCGEALSTLLTLGVAAVFVVQAGAYLFL